MTLLSHLHACYAAPRELTPQVEYHQGIVVGQPNGETTVAVPTHDTVTLDALRLSDATNPLLYRDISATVNSTIEDVTAQHIRGASLTCARDLVEDNLAKAMVRVNLSRQQSRYLRLGVARSLEKLADTHYRASKKSAGWAVATAASSALTGGITGVAAHSYNRLPDSNLEHFAVAGATGFTGLSSVALGIGGIGFGTVAYLHFRTANYFHDLAENVRNPRAADTHAREIELVQLPTAASHIAIDIPELHRAI